MAQGSGPNPIENAAMYTIKQTRGSQPMSSTVPGSILESGSQLSTIVPVQFLFSSKYYCLRWPYIYLSLDELRARSLKPPPLPQRTATLHKKNHNDLTIFNTIYFEAFFLAKEL